MGKYLGLLGWPQHNLKGPYEEEEKNIKERNDDNGSRERRLEDVMFPALKTAVPRSQRPQGGRLSSRPPRRSTALLRP